MSILTIPGKRWQDQIEPGEDATYDALNATAAPRAVIQPNSEGLGDIDQTSLGPLTQTASLGVYGAVTKIGDQSVAAGGFLNLETAGEPEPALGADFDWVVCVADIDPNIMYRGHVLQDLQGDGTIVPQVHLQAINNTSTPHTILDGTVIKFVCVGGTVSPQPTTPNAELVITPGKVYNLSNDNNPLASAAYPESILADGLNQVANPIPSVADHSITGVELNGTDLLSIANRYAGKRATLTVAGPVHINANTRGDLGTVTITGAVDEDVVIVNQPGPSTVFYGAHVSAPNTITITARNLNTFASVNIVNGLVLTAMLLQAP